MDRSKEPTVSSFNEAPLLRGDRHQGEGYNRRRKYPSFNEAPLLRGDRQRQDHKFRCRNLASMRPRFYAGIDNARTLDDGPFIRRFNEAPLLRGDRP